MTQALASLSYQPKPTLVFDFGLAHGLNEHSDATTLFAGLAILFAPRQ
jgi:hypothetical protein